ncbi:MAG: hypothetical protein ABMA14_10645 [Hyphomonadaceae bacterium]
MDTTAGHDVTRRRGADASRFWFASKHVLAGLCAFAILFQLLFIQTHVHPASLEQFASVAQGSAVSVELAGPAKHKLPSDGSRGECFICQQMALAGSVILPDLTEPVLLRRETDAVPVLAVVAAVRPLASHSWRSRGPPSRT